MFLQAKKRDDLFVMSIWLKAKKMTPLEDGVILEFAVAIKLGDREKTTAKSFTRRSANHHILRDCGVVHCRVFQSQNNDNQYQDSICWSF